MNKKTQSLKIKHFKILQSNNIVIDSLLNNDDEWNLQKSS